jgi:hypothetical protein
LGSSRHNPWWKNKAGMRLQTTTCHSGNHSCSIS